MKTYKFHDFLNALRKVKSATSTTGKATYSEFTIDDTKVHFKRDKTGKQWAIQLNDLFEIVNTLDAISYTILKNSMKGRIYSPSWAVLVAAGFYNQYGERIAP